VKKNRGFGAIAYLVLVVVILGMVGGLWAAYEFTCNKACQNWREIAGEQASALADLRAQGDARAKRAEAAGREAVGKIKALQQELANERKNTEAALARNWRDAIAERMRPPVGSGDAATAAAGANAAACTSAINDLLAAALAIHSAATLNTEQLKQLQAWIREAAK
jgi:hypothetical protein